MKADNMFRVLLISTCAFPSICCLATADLVYAFDQDNYDVAVGETVAVDIFLAQREPTSDDPIDLTVDGLISGGVRVFFNDNAPEDPAQVLSAEDVVPNPLFDDTFVGLTLDLVPRESVGFADGVETTPLRGERILLGTVQFTAGNTIGAVTHLRAERFSMRENSLAGDLAATSLDGITNSGFATITVTAVPEPSPVILLAMVAAGMACYRRQNWVAA